MIISKELLDSIETYSGLTLSEAHKEYISSYMKRRIEELNTTIEDYTSLVRNSHIERTALIDETAINETYFFREELQFDFLKNYYFPKHSDQVLKIWSAACSTGEEALSLYAICRDFGIKASIYASDIDTVAIEKFNNGIYSPMSFRQDGEKYAKLIKSLGTIDGGNLKIDREHLWKINRNFFNLNQPVFRRNEEETFDIIFLRNVFIYFTEERRTKIMKELWKALKPHGLLFVSMNEVASISPIEGYYKKDNIGDVYFFEKIGDISSNSKFSKFNELNNAISAFDSLTSRETTGTKDSPAVTVENSGSHEVQAEESEGAADGTMEAGSSSTTERCKTSIIVEQKCRQILEMINMRRLNQATIELERTQFRTETAEFKYYLLGLISLMKEDHESAEGYFSKATLASPKFWPAYFQLGMICKHQKNHEKSVRYFTLCLKILHEYTNSKKVCYNFLLESFSPEYFTSMCEKFIGETS